MTDLIRSFWDASPYSAAAVLLLLFLLTVLAILSVAGVLALLPGAPARRRARLLSRVHAVATARQVQTRQGGYQPDGRVYPDSAAMTATADLSIPRGASEVLPLELRWELRRPDGVLYHAAPTTYQRLGETRPGRASLRFDLPDVSPLLAHPGQWRLNLFLCPGEGQDPRDPRDPSDASKALRQILPQVPRALATWQVDVVDRSALLADLAAVDSRLVVLPGDDAPPYAGGVVLACAEAVAPQVALRPRTFHPSKYADGVDVTVELVCPSTGHVANRAAVRVPFQDGAARLTHLSRLVAGTELAAAGAWEFRVCVGPADLPDLGRLVARLPFTVVPTEQAADLIRVDRFDVVATEASGRDLVVGTEVGRANLRSLAPVIRLSTAAPSRRVTYAVSVTAVADDRPVGEVSGEVVMESTAGFDFAPGRLPAAQLCGRRKSRRGRDGGTTAGPAGTAADEIQDIRLTFLLLAGERCLARRDVLLRAPVARFADVQGRLVPRPRGERFDYAAEAARILADARGQS